MFDTMKLLCYVCGLIGNVLWFGSMLFLQPLLLALVINEHWKWARVLWLWKALPRLYVKLRQHWHIAMA